MRTKEKAASLAKKLLKIVLDERGNVIPEKVDALLVVLREKRPKNLRAILDLFYLKLGAQIRKNIMEVFHNGALSEAEFLNNLQKKFESHYGRVLKISKQMDEALIAGLQVCIADDIWEVSVRGCLASLRKPLA